MINNNELSLKQLIVKRLRNKKFSLKQNQKVNNILVNFILEKKETTYHVFFLEKENYTISEIKQIIQINKDIRLIAFNNEAKKGFIKTFNNFINNKYNNEIEKFIKKHSFLIVMAEDIVNRKINFP